MLTISRCLPCLLSNLQLHSKIFSLTDITESIQHIRNNNKQKNKDLSTLDLEEEIDTRVSKRKLYENSLLIGTLANKLLQHITHAELGGSKSQRTIDLEISTPIEKEQNVNPKDNLSVLAGKLDTLQKFFLTQISDIKADIKIKPLQKDSKRELY